MFYKDMNTFICQKDRRTDRQTKQIYTDKNSIVYRVF